MFGSLVNQVNGTPPKKRPTARFVHSASGQWRRITVHTILHVHAWRKAWIDLVPLNTNTPCLCGLPAWSPSGAQHLKDRYIFRSRPVSGFEAEQLIKLIIFVLQLFLSVWFYNFLTFLGTRRCFLCPMFLAALPCRQVSPVLNLVSQSQQFI